MLFFLVAAAMTLCVAAVLVRPLLRDLRPPPAAGRYNAGVYRDQLEELQRDADRAAIDPEQVAAARLEIERRLVSAAREPASEAPARRAPAALAFGLVALLALGGGGLYLAVGSPWRPDQPLASRDLPKLAGGPGAPGGDALHDRMDQLVALLARRLAADPNHADGWTLLARSYVRMDRPRDAVAAYARAVALTPGDDPQLDREYAEARVIANGGRVDEDARALFRRLLAADRKDPQSRYYLALARAQGGDVPGALADWKRLEADSPAGAPWLPTLRQRIAEASGQPAAPAIEPEGAAPVGGDAAAPAPDAAPGPTTAQMAAAGRLNAADRGRMVEGMVDRLAARLKSSPDDLDGWRRLARAYTVLGRAGDAKTAYRQVRRLAPDDPDARAALAGG